MLPVFTAGRVMRVRELGKSEVNKRAERHSNDAYSAKLCGEVQGRTARNLSHSVCIRKNEREMDGWGI